MKNKTRYTFITILSSLFLIIFLFLALKLNTTATPLGIYLSSFLLVGALFLTIFYNKLTKPILTRTAKASLIMSITFSVFFIFNCFFIYNVKIFNNDMAPTINTPKTIYVSLFNYKHQVNDVVYYNVDGNEFDVSRIRAKEEDVLTYEYVNEEIAYLLINGKYVTTYDDVKYNVIKNTALYNILKQNGNNYLMHVGELLIIGDNFNSEFTLDRIISDTRIVGKVMGVSNGKKH